MKTYLLGFALLTLAACGGSPLTIPAKDATKMVDGSPVEKIENVARPRPAATNICPPGAPILYRGNMTCPDRF
jgi:predicted small lipoprotein YifL